MIFHLGLTEIGIGASLLFLGGLLLFERKLSLVYWYGLMSISGIFHGYAYGESIIGAEVTPIVFYLIGFSLIQAFLIQSITWTVSILQNQTSSLQYKVGGCLFGMGCMFLYQLI